MNVGIRSGWTLGKIHVVEAGHSHRSRRVLLSLRHAVHGVVVDSVGGRLERVAGYCVKALYVADAVFVSPVEETSTDQS